VHCCDYCNTKTGGSESGGADRIAVEIVDDGGDRECEGAGGGNMSSGIEIPQQVVAQFCKKWKIVEFSLFGSVLRDDFRPESDVDVMVVFEADTPRGLEDLQEMRAELEGLFGRKVDLVEKRLIEQSENYIRRRHILNNLENLYVAG